MLLYRLYGSALLSLYVFPLDLIFYNFYTFLNSLDAVDEPTAEPPCRDLINNSYMLSALSVILEDLFWIYSKVSSIGCLLISSSDISRTDKQ